MHNPERNRLTFRFIKRLLLAKEINYTNKVFNSVFYQKFSWCFREFGKWVFKASVFWNIVKLVFMDDVSFDKKKLFAIKPVLFPFGSTYFKKWPVYHAFNIFWPVGSLVFHPTTIISLLGNFTKKIIEIERGAIVLKTEV